MKPRDPEAAAKYSEELAERTNRAVARAVSAGDNLEVTLQRLADRAHDQLRKSRRKA